MQNTLLNLFIFSFGILLYVVMIIGHQSVLEKLLVSEIGSLALCFSGISMLHSIKDKNEKGDYNEENN
jgi:hypothetical protein